MAITHGTSATNSATGTVTTCSISPTLTAARSAIIDAGATQTGGGTRTLSIADGGANTYVNDQLNGGVANPSYVWSIKQCAGGTPTIVVTASGNCASIVVALREYQGVGGGLAIAPGAKAQAGLSGTTAWDSTGVATGQTTDVLHGSAWVTNRSDTVVSSCDDGTGNSYTADLGPIAATGEVLLTMDCISSLGSATRKANMTASAPSTGQMQFVAYTAAAAGGTTLSQLDHRSQAGMGRGMLLGVN